MLPVRFLLAIVVAAVVTGCAAPRSLRAEEAKSATPIYIKLEVEDFRGFGAYKSKEAQWQPRMAWWPQWSRGGDSGWWAAEGPAEAASGEVSLDFNVPQTDPYQLWVRYEDYKGKAEPFDVVIDYPGGQAKSMFGRQDVGPAQPPFPYSYVWVKQPVALKKGPGKIHVVLAGAAEVRRCVDAIVLTTDASWTPRDRGFPPLAYSQYLVDWAKTRKPLGALVPSKGAKPPHVWDLPKSAGRDFWYTGTGQLISGFPRTVLIRDEPSARAFAAKYSANPKSAPIYSAPVCGVQIPIAQVKTLLEPANEIRKYILEQKVAFVLVGNYSSAGQVPNSYDTLKKTFGDLWLGIISGEGTYIGLPLFDKNIPLGPNFKEQEYQWLLTQGAAEWGPAIAKDWASQVPSPFEKVIFCASVGTLHNVHRLAEAGGQVLGTETAAAMPYAQQQAAFMRGASRQYGRAWAWYYGASFGDAIRTFTKESAYILEITEEKALVEKKQATPLKVENRNSVIGPSLAHIRRVLLNAYLQGASIFHPEQGYNLTGEDGQLNPMGWCYDETIRLATRHPDRGSICTPVAVLLDHAHGWEKYDYNGMAFGKLPCARPDRMIDGFFNVAYFPFPKNEGDPANDLNICWPNGYFGDIFDVLVTSPTKLDAIQNYPVVFCVGDTRLDPKWAAALKKYVADGGTLVINAEQVVPGMDESFLGARLSQNSKEASVVNCLPDGEKLAGTLFPYREAKPTTGKVIATTDSGDPVALVNAVGKGRVILTTPSYLLGHDLAPTPYLARLLLQVTQGLLPVEVSGNCEHYVNLHPKGYVVVLSNNEGIVKLSHSPAVMNRSQTSTVKLRLKEKPIKTEDWLGEEPRTWSFPNEWLLEYTKPMSVNWQKDADGYGATVTLQPGEIRVFFVQTR